MTADGTTPRAAPDPDPDPAPDPELALEREGALALELALPLPAEPAALLAQTRTLVARSPTEGAALIEGGEWIAEPLWRDWGAELEQAGMRRVQLIQVAVDYRMELWLWVMRERTWPQCASGLRGRVLRRLPGGPA